jgi:hypothetical protein
LSESDLEGLGLMFGMNKGNSMNDISYLDWISVISATCRQVYGHDYNNKPNDYCNWEGDACGVMSWVENDEHFRWRLGK